MFWNQEVKEKVAPIIKHLGTKRNLTFKLVAAALLGLLAALFQSAGGTLPGIGLLISPFSSAPIILCVLIGISYGTLSFVLSIILLLLIQPSEIIIFPFTTGSMAIGIGIGLLIFNRKWKVALFSSIFLFAGICVLLYALQFPVLGPFLTELSIFNASIIFLFSFIYCYLWTEFVIWLLPKIVYP